MARLFDNAADEYLRIDTAILSGPPLTMACWFNTDEQNIRSSLINIGDASDSNFLMLSAYGTAGADRVAVEITEVAGGQRGYSAIEYTANTWHHACAVFATSTDRRVFLDGGNKGTNVVDRTAATLDNTAIGAGFYNGAVRLPFSDRIAEAAIWNVALSDAEVAILGAGFSPLFVQPQNLVAYWPLIRDEDQDRVGGYDLTAYNAPSIGTHPPVIYPAAPFVGMGAGAAATTSTSTTTTTSTSTTSSSTSTTQTQSTSTSTSTTSSSTSTTSSSTSTSTTSSSTSTSTTLAFSGGLAFGEESPVGETPVSWQTWSDGAAGLPTIIGDSDWGKIELDVPEEGRSRVYDFGDADSRTITVTENKYGAGQQDATIQIRGQNTPFTQDDANPSWETYSAPTNKTWRFIQVRAYNQS